MSVKAGIIRKILRFGAIKLGDTRYFFWELECGHTIKRVAKKYQTLHKTASQRCLDCLRIETTKNHSRPPLLLKALKP